MILPDLPAFLIFPFDQRAHGRSGGGFRGLCERLRLVFTVLNQAMMKETRPQAWPWKRFQSFGTLLVVSPRLATHLKKGKHPCFYPYPTHFVPRQGLLQKVSQSNAGNGRFLKRRMSEDNVWIPALDLSASSSNVWNPALAFPD